MSNQTLIPPLLLDNSGKDVESNPHSTSSAR